MSAASIDDQDVIEQLSPSLQQWMILERFHLHNVRSYQNPSRDPAFDARYFPQNCRPFRLPCFWVQRRHLYVRDWQAEGSDELGFFAGERILFPIHPSSLGHYQPFLSDVGARDAAADGLCIWAVPTSSTRTLLAWPDGAAARALFIKTSLHSPIFGDRRVSRLKVARSVGISRVVRDSSADLPPALRFLPEAAGFSPRNTTDCGAVIRPIPREIKDGRVLAAPLFSLVGGGGSHVPLLLTLLDRSAMEPVRFVEEVLCAPFARLWLEMTMCHGLILEAHGQDLLLALSPELVPLGRFYYRDFEGLQVDWDLRRRNGWPAPHDMPHAWRWRETYATWGYRYCEFVWYKWRISLYDYLHFVLNEVEVSLRKWHERGLFRGPKCEQDEITMIFSRHLFAAIERMFDVRMEAPYNIYRSLNRFVTLLLKLRRITMRADSVRLSSSNLAVDCHRDET